MKITLVGPEKEENLSIRYLSSSLLAAGHEVGLAAFDGPEDSEAVLSASAGATIVGLSMCFQARAREFLELACSVKTRNPDTLVVAGGHFASCAARDLLCGHPELDLVVIHEGERTLVEIAEAWDHDRASMSDIRGIAWRDEAGVRYSCPRPILEDLDSLPPPDRRGPVRLVAGVPTAYLFGSRGCLSSCDYCCIRTLHALAPGKRFRQRHPWKTADEMADLYYGRGIRQFIFHDDNFLVPSEARNHQRLDALERAMRAKGFGEIGLYMKCRPGDVTRGILEKLRDMGLVRLFMGIESSTAQGYASLGRRQTVEESEEALRICDELGISAQYTLLIFHPEATVQTIRSDLHFMREHVNQPFNFGRAELNAGTPLERRMMDAGRARGNYLGRGYTMIDPVAELVWSAWRTILGERCTSETGLMNSAILLNYLSAVMNRFYDGSRVRKLSGDIEDWRLRVGRTSLDLLETLLDGCLAHPDPTDSRLSGLLREIRQQERVTNAALYAEFEELHRRLDALTLGMVGLEERDGRMRRLAGARKGSVARHVLAVALAFQVAGTIPAFGCCDMEQRILDMDHDNLYDDLELRLFGTDPGKPDTDGDRTSDDLEDHDSDGVVNLDEQRQIEDLVTAARTGSIAEMRRQIDLGADLDAVDPASEETALTGAARSGHLDVVVALLQAGADVNAKSLVDNTALMNAADSDHPEVVRTLIDEGADLEAVTLVGGTALMRAAGSGSAQSMNLLIAAGVNLEARDNYGQTALTRAASGGRSEALKILLDHGADVNTQGTSGLTPLMMATLFGHTEIVQILLQKGAALNTRNKDGKTALAIAREKGHGAIKTLLLKAGAK